MKEFAAVLAIPAELYRAEHNIIIIIMTNQYVTS
jgi:hypothetical protein